MTALVEARQVSRIFSIGSGFLRRSHTLRAVDRVDFNVNRGEVVAIVGESGCGKSTLAKMLLGLLAPSSGEILMEGAPIGSVGRKRLARRMQPVFQDPYASLNPRSTVASIVKLPLVVHGIGTPEERRERVLETLDAVGLARRFADSYPNQLSGGQRQRVAIARALIMRPQLLICDEPTSALDVSVQSQVLNLLIDLRREYDLTYVLISHNLALVEHMATRVCVMHLGRVVEAGDSATVFGQAKHPYTRALLDSVLTPDPRLGIPELPLRSAAAEAPEGYDCCLFADRCPHVFDLCLRAEPPLYAAASRVKCHLYRDGAEVPAREAVPA